jgi:hypothetical protein
VLPVNNTQSPQESRKEANKQTNKQSPYAPTRARAWNRRVAVSPGRRCSNKEDTTTKQKQKIKKKIKLLSLSSSS